MARQIEVGSGPERNPPTNLGRLTKSSAPVATDYTRQQHATGSELHGGRRVKPRHHHFIKPAPAPELEPVEEDS